MSLPLLEVSGLRIEFRQESRSIRVVDGVDFSIAEGESLGLVGESGCGKSVTAAALVRLLPAGGIVAGGTVRWHGLDLSGLPAGRLPSIRGREIALLPQEPGGALDPAFTIGDQLGEVLALHQGLGGAAASERAAELLASLGVADVAARLRARPHQLSGGLRQRVALALALAGEPALLIADEPTSALDPAVALQVAALLDEQRRRRRLAMLLISHDLALVARHCDRALVMYAGRIVEDGPARDLLRSPRHPYTQALVATRSPARPLRPGERFGAIPGSAPAAIAWPSGCRFHPRCPMAIDSCGAGDPPPLQGVDSGRRVACPVVPGVGP
jgi:oligopeptide/dipeptide ABC transporter ATP-binding protein